jgi:hypothetical protein
MLFLSLDQDPGWENSGSGMEKNPDPGWKKSGSGIKYGKKSGSGISRIRFSRA